MNRKISEAWIIGLGALTFPAMGQAVKRPLVISTWDSGMAVNAVAWEALVINGKAIDAVEAGAMSIENEINSCVGNWGLTQTGMAL